MPYGINPFQGHAMVDLTADSSRESNLGWDYTRCFLALQPIPGPDLPLPLEAHRQPPAPPSKDAAQLPDGPLLRHLRFGATLDEPGLEKYSQHWPQVDTMMHLIAEFAHHLFGDQALDPISRTLYPVYDGASYQTALADALTTLWLTEVPVRYARQLAQ